MARKILNEKSLRKVDNNWLAREFLGVDKRIEDLYARSERIRKFYRGGICGIYQSFCGIKNTISRILIQHNEEIESLEGYLGLVAKEVQNRGLDTPLFAERYGLQDSFKDCFSYEL